MLVVQMGLIPADLLSFLGVSPLLLSGTERFLFFFFRKRMTMMMQRRRMKSEVMITPEMIPIL